MEQVKLIWEFRGADSLEIAKHHVKHLQEFSKARNLDNSEANIKTISEMYSQAWLKINKEGWEKVAEILKPHKVVQETT